MKEFGWMSIDGQYSKKHVSQVTNKDKIYDDLGRKLVPRKGNARHWHFALGKKETKFLCDDLSYKSNKGTWHRNWQSYSPSTHLEVYKYVNSICHIADMIDRYGNIVEFQHSNISEDDIRSREHTYGSMYWIIDATQAQYIILEDSTILIKEDTGWWDFISRPILFDIGIGLAFVRQKLYNNGNTRYYYCNFLSYADTILNLFVLKSDYKPLEEHFTPKISSQTIKYRYTTFYGIWKINTVSDDPKVVKFGFRNGILTLCVSSEFLKPTSIQVSFPDRDSKLDNFIRTPEVQSSRGSIICVSKVQIELTPDKKYLVIGQGSTSKRRTKKMNWELKDIPGERVDLNGNSLMDFYHQR